MTSILLSCRNLSKQFGPEKTLFSDISFDIFRGETVAITGKSGSGKTTLLHILATLEPLTSGSIFFSDDLPYKNILHNIGFVFQGFHLLEDRTAIENILLPVRIAGVNYGIKRDQADYLLRRLEITHLAHQYVRNLSGGEKQRVAIARALILDPPLIFADEPTGNLDRETGATIQKLLLEISQERNRSLLLVTHDRDFALNCTKQYELSNSTLILYP